MATVRQLEHRDHTPSRQPHPLVLLLNDIKLPVNVGSLFRLSDALGIEKLYLTGQTPTPPNRKIRKTSRATENYVPYEYTANAQTVIATLKQQGYTLIALEITSHSVNLESLDYARFAKMCLILGAEDSGIDAALLSTAHHTVHIPMAGRNSSMNLVAACAIAAHRITTIKQQTDAQSGRRA